ncbi:TPA: hypothetical protein N0F65_003543 [Lagenidium giganteum]|uniref:Two-pore calcium channel n=1 Tax=Lagenidium giganteum TaxID=4803 RepID=A0AAV2Z2P8_9STRA|nr:TPA: hypothetical protein N0F65_003543 [Lagenidium giganteum]
MAAHFSLLLLRARVMYGATAQYAAGTRQPLEASASAIGAVAQSDVGELRSGAEGSRSSGWSSSRDAARRSVTSDVFIPVVCSIFGVIIFMRLGTVVGVIGWMGAVMVISLAFAIVLLTIGSISAIVSSRDQSQDVFEAMRVTLGGRLSKFVGAFMFLSFTVGCAYYLLGFAEITQYYLNLHSKVNVLPWNEAGSWLSVLVASGVLGLLFCVHAVGLKPRRYLLRFVFVVVLTAIISNVFLLVWPNSTTRTGFSSDHLRENWRGSEHEAFVWAFSTFFPAFSGVLAGTNFAEHMSMWRVPGQSRKRYVQQLILGVYMAISFAFTVYVLLGFVLASSADNSELLKEKFVVQLVVDSVLGVPIIYLGVAFTTLSSAFSNILAASSVLRDTIVRRTTSFRTKEQTELMNHHLPRSERSRNAVSQSMALWWSWILTQLAVMCGTVDTIIPIVSATFLVTFASINFACFVHDITTPSFRPNFRLYSRWTAFAGFLLSLGAFFAVISALFTILASILGLLLVLYYRKDMPVMMEQIRIARRTSRGNQSTRGSTSRHHGFLDSASPLSPFWSPMWNSEKMAHIDDLDFVEKQNKYVELAAMYVRDALHGRSLGEEYLVEGLHRIRSKRLFHALHYVRTGNMVVLLLLNVFERPSWCYFLASCGDTNKVRTWGLPVLSPKASILIELASLLLLSIEMFMKYSAVGPRLYFANRWRVMQLLLLLADFVSVLVVIFVPANVNNGSSSMDLENQPLMLAPLLRPMLILTMSHRLRAAFISLLKATPRFIDGIVTLVVLIAIFAVLGMLLFEDTAEGQLYFSNFEDSCLNLLVLLTTANFPDVMMPIFEQVRSASIFFMSFLSIGLLLVMNLVFASIYQNYRQEVAARALKHADNRLRALKLAFELLAGSEKSLGSESASLGSESASEVVSHDSMNRLMSELKRPAFAVFHDESSNAFDDENSDLGSPCGAVDFDQFIVVIKTQAQTQQSTKLLNDGAGFKSRMRSNRLAKFVTSKSFEKIVDVVILTNLFAILMEIQAKIDDEPELQHSWERYMPVYSVVCFVEMVLKMYSYRLNGYFSTPKNVYDCVVTVVISVAEISLKVHYVKGMSWNWVRLLLVLRFLRCLRLLVALKSLNSMFAIVIRLLPAFTTLYGMLGLVMVEYAVIGEQLFGGKLVEGDEVLAATTYGKSNYYSNNFNDFASAMTTLFELLLVNNWNVVMEGTVAVTTRWSRVYFISFYVIGVVMVLSLVVAFVVEAYFEATTALEKKSTNESCALTHSVSTTMEETSTHKSTENSTTRLTRRRSMVLHPRADSVYVEEFL